MNFYTGVGTSLISQEASQPPKEEGKTRPTDNESGFELNTYIGGEFFFPGLSSLGFSFEAGLGITSISSQVRLRTFGDHPLKAGVIFYF